MTSSRTKDVYKFLEHMMIFKEVWISAVEPFVDRVFERLLGPFIVRSRLDNGDIAHVLCEFCL